MVNEEIGIKFVLLNVYAYHNPDNSLNQINTYID